jgi:hypothetical protein
MDGSPPAATGGMLMCEIRDERSVTVCDVALDRYRAALGGLGDAVSFVHVDYQPTLIECHDETNLPEFQRLVRELREDAPAG